MTATGATPRGARPPSLLVVSNMYPSAANPVFGTFVRGQVAALEAAGVPVRLVANTEWRTGGVAAVRKYPLLASRAVLASLGGRFDAVVGHYLYPTAVVARAAARVARCPYVLVAHGTDVIALQRDGRLARASRKALRGAAGVIAVSRHLERALRETLALPASVPTAVVHMGVDLGVFRPLPDARERLGWARGERVALYIGNLVEPKGLAYLAEAFGELRRRDACDRLVLVGEGRYRAELERRFAEEGVADRVRFEGRLTGDEVALRTAAADVVALPSLAEGLGLVLLEAMACGTPCVGTRVGGIPEVVDDSRGRVVPPADAAALAEGMVEVLSAGKGSFSAACLSFAAGNGVEACARRFVDEVAGMIGRQP